MNKKIWVLLGATFLFVLTFFNQETTVVEEVDSRWTKSLYREGTGQAGSLALIKIEGVLLEKDDTGTMGVCDYEVILETLQEVFNDPQVKGVMLFINSPGGGVYESHEIYRQIKNLKQKYPKPVVAYLGKTATSGGYYVALPADYIYANPNTLTGSIGVIIASINIKNLADKIGVEYVVFKSGKNKDMLSSMNEMTAESKEIMQSIVDESYGYFLQAFIEERHLDRETAIKLADGRIYTAKQAGENGIIDDVMELNEAFERLAQMAQITDPCIYEYKCRSRDWWLSFLGVNIPGKDLLRNLINKPINGDITNEWLQQQSQLMYMSTPGF